MKKPSKPASKPAKARPRRALKRKGRNVFKPRRSSSFADELARVTRERDDALQQQTATSEVLQVISRSAGNLQPVFEIILENAVRICDAKFGVLYLHEGGRFRLASAHNVPRGYAKTCAEVGLRNTSSAGWDARNPSLKQVGPHTYSTTQRCSQKPGIIFPWWRQQSKLLPCAAWSGCRCSRTVKLLE